MIVGTNERVTMDLSEANPTGITYRQMFDDPDAMLRRQLEHQNWVRHNVPQDAEMGLTSAGWNVGVVRYNVYEAAWFGCEVVFDDGQVPDTTPCIATEADKKTFLEEGAPDPFDQPFMRKAWEDWRRLEALRKEGFEFLGRPLSAVYPPACGTDGPVTVACNVRGASEFLLDLYEDPSFADDLLDLITDATIARIRAIRREVGQPEAVPGFGFADDSCQLLSLETYSERVLPRHRRLVAELGDGTPGGIHLCGNAVHLLPTIAEKLNVRSFDTGFPIDLGALRAALGPGAEILGGPSVPMLRSAAPEEVRCETRGILASGVMEGGRFILREGNNLAPGTPLENLQAMYDTVREFGRYAA